jgi:hypothetical protein
MFFRIVVFFWIKISFIEKQKNDVDDVIFSRLKVCWALTSSSLNVVCCIFLKSIECRIDFVRHMFEILSFLITLILHWNDQIEWLFSKLTHFFCRSIFCTLNHYAIRRRLNIVAHVDRSCRCDHIADN